MAPSFKMETYPYAITEGLTLRNESSLYPLDVFQTHKTEVGCQHSETTPAKCYNITIANISREATY